MVKFAACLLSALAALAAAGASFGSSAAGTTARSTGVFDTGCSYSHTLRDDPLVHPGVVGASHVHDFFGNRITEARSTGNSLLVSTRANPAMGTTCKDKQDGSGYWAPALYADGSKVRPDKVHVYYRHRGPTAARAFPVGFGMVTQKHYWWCGPGSEKHKDGTIPACASGRLFVVLTFPACWDGTRLFAKDGSHVSHGMRCDAAHPIRLPQLTMILSYRVDGKPHAYTLSSGTVKTSHADFLNAWEPDRLARLVDACLNHGRVADCER